MAGALSTPRGPRPRGARAWARGAGLSLWPSTAGALEGVPGIEQALRDGIERGYAGGLPRIPEDARVYAIHSQGILVGVLACVLGRPAEGDALVVAIAIDPAHRGAALGARALALAERRLRREGVRGFWSVVPRTNGRGLYFMLRCGYAPLAVAPSGLAIEGVTWFRRHLGGPVEAGR